MIDQRAGASRGQDIHKAGRHARLFQQRHQRQHGQRGFRGRLDDDAAAHRQRGGDLSGAHRCGIVPRRDQNSQPRRLVLDNDPGTGAWRAGNQAVGAHGLFGEPAKELGRIGRLAHRIGARLSVLQRDQVGKILKPRGHQLPSLAKDFGAVSGRLAGPILHRGCCGIESGIGIGNLGRGHRGEHAFCRRVDHVEPFATRARAPGAVDIQICMLHGSLRRIRAGGAVGRTGALQIR